MENDKLLTENMLTTYTAEDVYEILRKEIITLRRLPGSAITENSVAQRFGLSRTPVRSVFARLAQEGLMDLNGRRGSFVSLIDLNLAVQIIFLRVQTEYGVMRQIAQHPNALLFSKLETNLAQQTIIAEENRSDEEFYRVDSRFHELCMEYTGKSRLWKLIQGMDVHYARYRRLDYSTFKKKNTFSNLRDQHEILLQFMRDGKCEQLYRAITTHLYSGILRIGSDLFETYFPYFDMQPQEFRELLHEVKLQINEA